MLVGMPLLRVFDRIGYGGMILAASGQPLAINDSAQRILSEVFNLDSSIQSSLGESGRELIKQLLNRGKSRIQFESENWIIIGREIKRPLIMSAVPLASSELELRQESPHTVLMLIDLETGPQPNSAAMERIFRLTPTEAKLAALYATGASTAEAAMLQGVSVATIRTQTSAIFDKTQTRRQADIIRLMARLSALP